MMHNGSADAIDKIAKLQAARNRYVTKCERIEMTIQGILAAMHVNGVKANPDLRVSPRTYERIEFQISRILREEALEEQARFEKEVESI